MNLKEKIQSLSGARGYLTITVPEIGEVKLRTLTEQEWQTGVVCWFRDSEYQRIPDRTKYDNAKLIQMCLVDPETDTPLFTDSLQDLDTIVNLKEPISNAIYSAAYKLNRPDLPKN